MSELRHSPLHEAHRHAGAKFAAFGGWEMPLSYPDGVLAEHAACRTDAAVFDVSHLGSLRVRGDAVEGLQRAFTNDLSRISPGRAQYTHLLDVSDGSVVDDIIVWWVTHDEVIVMPNASNTDALSAALGEELGSGVEITDITARRCVLAVQGPHARRSLAVVGEGFAETGRFRVAALTWQGARCIVAGTGYTGEDGVEIHVPAERAIELWEALVEAGVTPAGLGARDTLRLEMGYPLHGHELGAGITPLQAGLDWVVAFDKESFRGRDALVRERERGVARRLRGLSVDGRRVPRAGCAVRVGSHESDAGESSVDGADAASATWEVTSGNFSPTLGHSIALAFLPPGTPDGTRVDIDVRGTALPAIVTPTPFLARER